MEPVIQARDLHFAYGEQRVLSGIDLTITPGEIVVLLGPNGAGKTTLVELLMGSLKPHAGSVWVLGRDPRETNGSWVGEIGLVMQQYSDHGKWKVREFLDWVHSHYVGAGQRAMAPSVVLERVGLSDKADVALVKLSGGQRRRVDFAAALIGLTKLMILDEPTTGLDPEARAQLHLLIQDAVEAGATVLMTTHDMEEAQDLADRVLVLNGGRIVASGSPQQLRDELVSPSQITWFEGEKRQVHSTFSPEAFLKTLDLDAITGIEVSRSTLKDAYLALVAKPTGEPDGGGGTGGDELGAHAPGTHTRRAS